MLLAGERERDHPCFVFCFFVSARSFVDKPTATTEHTAGHTTKNIKDYAEQGSKKFSLSPSLSTDGLIIYQVLRSVFYSDADG